MAKVLVLIEHDRQQVKRPSLHAITLARQLTDDYALLVLGHGLDGIAASLVSYGASAVIVADDAALVEPLADRYAAVIAQAARKYGAKTLIGSSSTFSKDILPRAAALLISARVCLQRCGARSFCVTENEIGHLVLSAMRSIIGRSS